MRSKKPSIIPGCPTPCVHSSMRAIFHSSVHAIILHSVRYSFMHACMHSLPPSLNDTFSQILTKHIMVTMTATIKTMMTKTMMMTTACLRPHLSICHMPTRVPTELTAAGSIATSRAVRLSLNPASSKIAGV